MNKNTRPLYPSDSHQIHYQNYLEKPSQKSSYLTLTSNKNLEQKSSKPFHENTSFEFKQTPTNPTMNKREEISELSNNKYSSKSLNKDPLKYGEFGMKTAFISKEKERDLDLSIKMKDKSKYDAVISKEKAYVGNFSKGKNFESQDEKYEKFAEKSKGMSQYEYKEF